MSQPLSLFCVYTIRQRQRLDDVYRGGGDDTFEEKKSWKTGRQLFVAAQKNGMRMPVIFASVDVGNKLLYHAILSKVEVDEDNYTTKYSFTDLIPIEGGYPLSSLRLRSTCRSLSDNYIRPYAICHTPSFIQP